MTDLVRCFFAHANRSLTSSGVRMGLLRMFRKRYPREWIASATVLSLAFTLDRRINMARVTSWFPPASSTILSSRVQRRSTFAPVKMRGRPIGRGAFFWASKRLTVHKLRFTKHAMRVRDMP